MASMPSMSIGNGSKARARRAAAEEAHKNSKHAILARKRERWKLQKEVHDAQQKFKGRGQRLGDSGVSQRAPSLPGTIESPSPPRQADGGGRVRGRPVRDYSALSNLEDNDILTQLTERIANRLKVELRQEVEDAPYTETAKKDVTTKIESFL